jgi:Arf-GAP/coiled-coil/ANK repeat/PH domain-containing protein
LLTHDRDSLDTASTAQQALCKVLREFCGDVTEEESLGIGAGVMIRYISAFNEISSFYDLLRSQVNLLMIDQLDEVLLGPMNAVRDGKKRVDKSASDYDSCRRKFLGLQKTVEDGIVLEAEKDLRHAKNTYDADRFGLARSLLSIHHTKRSFFVETTSEMVDAHMRFFKQGFDLIRVMEPYIHESLAQCEDWRKASDMDMDVFDESIAKYLEQSSNGNGGGDADGQDHTNNGTSSNQGEETNSSENSHQNQKSGGHQRSLSHGSSIGAGSFTNQLVSSPTGGNAGGPVQMSALQSQMAQGIEASMKMHKQKGDVIILKQGYLLKRSSNIRGDWKRRFFVLDSKGSLYYYTKNLAVIKSINSNQKTGSNGGGAGHPGVPHETVELLTSTVKMDAEGDENLRFCFRIVSPMRTYTLQAESDAERATWIGAIQCVIASLLSSVSGSGSNPAQESASNALSRGPSSALDEVLSTHSIYTDGAPSEVGSDGIPSSPSKYASAHSFLMSEESYKDSSPVLETLRSVSGNDCCADCGAPMPDWASLNLTVTLCIECSGTHRKLGVHISKVRSMTLDDNVWDETVMKIFQSAGNSFINGILEKRLKEKKVKDDDWLWNADDNEPVDKPDLASPRRGSILQIPRKPNPSDPLSLKEEYIRAKYVTKAFMDAGVAKDVMGDSPPQEFFWPSMFSADYRSIMMSILYGADANAAYGEKLAGTIFEKREKQAHQAAEAVFGKAVPAKDLEEVFSKPKAELGLTALHVMSELKEVNVLDLLTLHSGNVNAKDVFQRTPLHYCILNQWDEGAKLLLKRGGMAAKEATDIYGITALEMAMGRGQLTDQDLFTLLAQ